MDEELLEEADRNVPLDAEDFLGDEQPIVPLDADEFREPEEKEWRCHFNGAANGAQHFSAQHFGRQI